MADLALRVDSASFGRLVRDVKSFDKNLYTATRKRLRDAAKPAVQDVKTAIGTGPSFRSGLAAGTRVSISTGARAGIRIITDGSHLPADKQAMVKAWDKPSFGHPTFGNRDNWVTQSGHPYFNRKITARLPQIRNAVEDALRDAVKQMGH